VVEIGAIRFTAQGEVIDQFDQLINPGCRMPAAAQAIHGISDNDLVLAPVAAEVLPRFLGFLGNSLQTMLVAHNASFDSGFLGRELHSAGHHLPGDRIFDTLALARRRLPDLRHHRLESLAIHFDLEHGRLHRALGDSLLVKELWLRLEGPSAPAEMLVSYPIHDPQQTASAPHGCEALGQAILSGAMVAIAYDGGTRGLSMRPITPLRFVQRGGETYIVAYCHLDSLEKSFRVDRIRSCAAAPAFGRGNGQVDPEPASR
jgi:DNA polymerase III epsilon subunit family exonuclease